MKKKSFEIFNDTNKPLESPKTPDASNFRTSPVISPVDASAQIITPSISLQEHSQLPTAASLMEPSSLVDFVSDDEESHTFMTDDWEQEMQAELQE